MIGYAYDDRWGSMTVKDFFRRRIIRLQPMVIMGMIVGAAFFYFQDSPMWPGISEVPVWKMLLIMVIGFTVLPVPVSMDIRGWTEMHPLNGPAWSLFFEYIANVLYALFLRKISNILLTVLTLIAGAALVHMAVTSPSGDIIGGWAIDPVQLRIGFSRLLYPFLAGLLMSRVVKIAHIKNAFLWCSLMLMGVLAMPRIGGAENLWMNGLYDSLIIMFAFPVIIYLGAGGRAESAGVAKVTKFFGDISYPLYITHYPLVYTYAAWVSRNKVPMEKGLPVGIAVIAASIILAYACLKLYDEPARKWLGRKFLSPKI
ncbi:acyltransferase [uncultured Flavobacterium sp.]|uniref:acyltransferase family protein n=1 Tax=uncultured Flavobacterium sp. TaxID=165435 RepID=UPI00345158BF